MSSMEEDGCGCLVLVSIIFIFLWVILPIIVEVGFYYGILKIIGMIFKNLLGLN